MSHKAQLNSNLKNTVLVLIASCTLMGCSLFDKKPSAHARMAQVSKQKVFYANYDSVWRAAHAAIKYPLAQENQDTGIIETEYIKGIDGWIAPDQKPPSTGLRYKLILTFAKGKVDNRESVRITVLKKMEILKDFFSTPEMVESDGLEEKVLFYRIERELIISEALKKVE